MAKEYSEDVKEALKTVVDYFDKEDRAMRETFIRKARRLKQFWDGFENLYYSDVAHDWRIPPQEQDDVDSQQSYYDKPVNVFRAYLESIIAALSVTVPGIKCYPDDADNPQDIITARTGDKVAKLIARHNEVNLLWLHALYIYCTEGLVAAYHYSKEDEKYGTYDEERYETVEEQHRITSCPSCSYQIEDEVMGADDIQFVPDEVPETCPNCGIEMVPTMEQESVSVEKLIEIITKPKARQCIEAYGGLYVKVAAYAKKQEDTPYLIFSHETHYANVIERYEFMRDKLRARAQVYDAYDAWGRIPLIYNIDYPSDNVTVRNIWLRPAAFNILDEDKVKLLKKEFPDGCKTVFINDDFAEACGCELDKEWTLTFNPLSDYLQHEPLGTLLVTTQEITNDLISLVLQTIEHGIGQMFVDPAVLDFNKYRQSESLPGAIFPAKAKSGKALGEGFYEAKTATLSQEVLPFTEKIQEFGQLVSGALPSLFGGALQEQKTASGYAMSRAQALQRQQNTWKVFTGWWREINKKVIPAYIEDIAVDERDVQRDVYGNFINEYIRISELSGKIGKIELEASENLPVSWAQRKDTIMGLFQINNPEILATLAAPENLPLIREAVGLDDFYVPGEDDRTKQYEEIALLLSTEPLQVPQPMMNPMTGAPEVDPIGMPIEQIVEEPSVEVDPDIDNHQVEFEICRTWLISDAGRLAKVDNPAGYKNVLLHAKQHLMIMQQAMMAQQQAQMMAESQASGAKGVAPGKKPKETDKEAPIQGESDVRTI